MTLITRIPGTPDPTLPQATPYFGIAASHLYLPRTLDLTGGKWGDVIGGKPMDATGTLQTEGGIGYLQTNGSSTGAKLALSSVTDVTTVVIVARILTGGVAPTPHFFSGGAVALGQASTGGTPYVARGGTQYPLAPSPAYGKWRMYAFTAPTGADGTFVVDGSYDTVVGGTTVLSTIRVGINGSDAFRAAQCAAIVTSATAATAATLKTATYPALRAYLAGLDWA